MSPPKSSTRNCPSSPPPTRWTNSALWASSTAIRSTPGNPCRYRPADFIDGNDELRAVLDLIADGTFSHGDTEVFKPLVDNLRYDDPFLVCADFASYMQCQEQVSAAWQDRDAWTKMSILNTARSGKFSSDRAIAEYCDDIWSVWPLTVSM